MQAWYRGLEHIGIWYHDGEVCVYVKNNQHMSSYKIKGLLERHVDITNISTYSKMER